MQREWRFGERFAAWLSRCAVPERRRLPAHVAAAFVDRTSIEWTSLLGRARGTADRQLLEGLRAVDRLRSASDAIAAAEAGTATRVAVRVLVALAALQTACCFAALGTALASGRASLDRISQIVLAVSFAAASVLLRATASADPRSLFLIGTFAAAASAFARGALT